MSTIKVLIFFLSLTFSLFFHTPSSWVGFVLKRFSGDVIGLVNTTGTIWEGSGDLILKPSKIFGAVSATIENKNRQESFIVLAKDINWKIFITKLYSHEPGIKIQLKHDSVKWEKKSTIEISKSVLRIPNGEANLPDVNLSDGNGFLGFSKPKFALNIKWSQFLFYRWSAIDEPFVMEVNLNDLETSLSPVKPLGSYRVVLTRNNGYFQWVVDSSDNSSLSFDASGDYFKALRGKGELECLRHCDYMTSLLSAIGKKQGDNVYGFVLGD